MALSIKDTLEGCITKVLCDEEGNNIKETYATNIETSGNILILKNKKGEEIDRVILSGSGGEGGSYIAGEGITIEDGVISVSYPNGNNVNF